MSRKPRTWAVVPAAGIGSRMGADVPKQYLPLHGATVLAHTVERLRTFEPVTGVVIAIARDDPWWPELELTTRAGLVTAEGGDERCQSVLNALIALSSQADSDDLVMVHDAARPCVRQGDLTRLHEVAMAHPDGALLGLPLTDTVKQADADGHVTATLDRNSLWRALTPQMFPLGRLREALADAVQHGDIVTDEASAMERTGARPLMVEGHADNIKITRPGDLALANWFLEQQDNDNAHR